MTVMRKDKSYTLMHGNLKTKRTDRDEAAVVADYVKRITATWQKSVTTIIDTGRLLIEAKAKLPHGSFQKMVKKLPFHNGVRTVQMLMEIARHSIISNAKFISYLPPCWGTLYELAALPIPNQEFERLITTGHINCDMTRQDVKDLQLYEYGELVKAVNVLVHFMTHFHQPAQLVPKLTFTIAPWNEDQMNEIRKLPVWLKMFHTAFEQDMIKERGIIKVREINGRRRVAEEIDMTELERTEP
jgi:hypothetical protein